MTSRPKRTQGAELRVFVTLPVPLCKSQGVRRRRPGWTIRFLSADTPSSCLPVHFPTASRYGLSAPIAILRQQTTLGAEGAASNLLIRS